MSVWAWLALAAVLVVCPIAAAIMLGRARETGDLDQLQEAFDDVEREIGEAFLPILRRVAAAIVEADAYLARSWQEGAERGARHRSAIGRLISRASGPFRVW